MIKALCVFAIAVLVAIGVGLTISSAHAAGNCIDPNGNQLPFCIPG